MTACIKNNQIITVDDRKNGIVISTSAPVSASSIFPVKILYSQKVMSDNRLYNIHTNEEIKLFMYSDSDSDSDCDNNSIKYIATNNCAGSILFINRDCYYCYHCNKNLFNIGNINNIFNVTLSINYPSIAYVTHDKILYTYHNRKNRMIDTDVDCITYVKYYYDGGYQLRYQKQNKIIAYSMVCGQNIINEYDYHIDYLYCDGYICSCVIESLTTNAEYHLILDNNGGLHVIASIKNNYIHNFKISRVEYDNHLFKNIRISNNNSYTAYLQTTENLIIRYDSDKSKFKIVESDCTFCVSANKTKKSQQ